MKIALWLSAALLCLSAARALPAAAPAQPAAIDWREGDVDDAFAEARESNKPVLLYWGAKWCPPCNQMKQTIFKDPGFIAETRNFIPVHLDGDDPGAQAWGDKFGIVGYPTVIILRPDRSEITRLSGTSAAASLAQVLALTAKRTASTEELLQLASTPKQLSPDDWLVLANFDWEDDPKHFADPVKEASFLATLAAAAPTPALSRKFTLTGLAIGSNYGSVPLSPAQQRQLQAILLPILRNRAEATADRDMLSEAAAPMILSLPTARQRQRLGAELVLALDQVAADTTLFPGDRLDTVNADIILSKAAHAGKVTPAVLAKVRARVAVADRDANTPGLRQAVIPDAGDFLDQAGDYAGAQKLLEGALPTAIAPYYFMIDLAGLAEEHHDPQAAIDWARKAADAAEGPATKVQWEIMYSDFVLRLDARNKPEVEQSGEEVIQAFTQASAGYAGRTRKKLEAWHAKVEAWSKANQGQRVLLHLNASLSQACQKQATQACAIKFS